MAEPGGADSGLQRRPRDTEQYPEGCYDEWYKGERGFAVTAFTTVAYGLAALLLDDGLDARDRDLLTVLRPHLHQAYLDAERRRHPAPKLTPRHWELLHLVAAGHTNAQIARRLGISEGTVRTHLENIYDRLGVSSRTAAVTRAFPDRAA